jgi:ATP-binding cassette subfamily B protein
MNIAATLDTRSAAGPARSDALIQARGIVKIYPTVSGEPVLALDHLDMAVRDGEFVCLVGPSGCGKSTLLRLLAGLCEPSHGHVEIDGIASLGMRDLRRCATLIPQEAQFFEATLRENIGFDLGHDDTELAAAAHIASLDTVLQALPQGLDTPIAQGGSNLSGGQRQRLCLTRGILAAQGSSVLLLDEPTSALDPLTEATVYERLGAAFPRACIVASVHRMSLLDRFDRIVLIVQGQIVDSGTREELLARQSLFREMVGTEASSAELAPPFSLGTS